MTAKKPIVFRDDIDWRKTPCPDRLKGSTCELCGYKWLCGDASRPKPRDLALRRSIAKKRG